MQENADAGAVAQLQPAPKGFIVGALVGEAVLALDLMSKYVFFGRPELMQTSYVAGLFRFTDHKNYGITFDLPIPQWLIVIVTIGLLCLVIFGGHRAFSQKRWSEFAMLVLIFNGALGNLFDRLFFGYVRDWILLWGRSAINIADLSIIVGLAGYIYLRSREEANPAAIV